MDQETKEMLQMIIDGMESMERRLGTRIDKVEAKVDAVSIKLENDVAKRIDTLFDGYKLTHEKQWETDRKLRELEARLERLESLQNVG